MLAPVSNRCRIISQELFYMSELLQPDVSRAEVFQGLHVYLPTDYDTYYTEMLKQWIEDTEDALEADKPIRPLWLRRTDDMGPEFGAIIDYIMPMPEGTRIFAVIDVNGDGGQTDISVNMPKDDGSGEPIVVMSEAYTLPALQRAIEFVESQVQPSLR